MRGLVKPVIVSLEHGHHEASGDSREHRDSGSRKDTTDLFTSNGTGSCVCGTSPFTADIGVATCTKVVFVRLGGMCNARSKYGEEGADTVKGHAIAGVMDFQLVLEEWCDVVDTGTGNGTADASEQKSAPWRDVHVTEAAHRYTTGQYTCLHMNHDVFLDSLAGGKG